MKQLEERFDGLYGGNDPGGYNGHPREITIAEQDAYATDGEGNIRKLNKQPRNRDLSDIRCLYTEQSSEGVPPEGKGRNLKHQADAEHGDVSPGEPEQPTCGHKGAI